MSTCFMLMNNPMDLIMNLVVGTTNHNEQTTLEGAIEKYKVDFDSESIKLFLRLKCLVILNSISYV